MILTAARTLTVSFSGTSTIFGIGSNGNRIALSVSNDAGATGNLYISNGPLVFNSAPWKVFVGSPFILLRKDVGTYICGEFWVGIDGVGTQNIYVSEIYEVTGNYPVGYSPLTPDFKE